MIARWDERWKLSGLIVLAIAASLVRCLPLSSTHAAIAIVLMVWSRMTWKSFLAGTGLLLMSILPLALSMPFLNHASTWQDSLIVVLRSLAVGWYGLTLITTTKVDRLFAALTWFRVPGVFVLLLQMAYRYSFLLFAELKRVRVAMQARGMVFGVNRKSIHATGQIIGHTLGRANRRSETVAMAMKARGFDSKKVRTMTTFQTSVIDVMLFLVCLGIAIVTVILRLFC